MDKKIEATMIMEKNMETTVMMEKGNYYNNG